jgi:hypothetical protein
MKGMLLIILSFFYLNCFSQDQLDSTLSAEALKEDLTLTKRSIKPIVAIQKLVAKPSHLFGYILNKSIEPGKDYSIIKIDSVAGKFWINDYSGSPVTIQSFISRDNSMNKVQVEDIFWTKFEADSIKKKYGIKIWNKIINRELVIGWSQKLCELCWGFPKKINTTTTAFGTNEQWIYTLGYLYFENGKLTAIQN